LAISSLVLPFNISANSQADVAVFRLPGRVYFVSDLEKQRLALKVFNCVKGKSHLETYLESDLSLLQKNSLPKLFASDQDEGELLKAVTPFMYLEKLKLTAVSRGKDRVSERELSLLGKGCSQYRWDTLNRFEKSLFISENFLRQRFKKGEGEILDYRNSLDVKDRHEFFRLRARKELK